MAALVSDGCGDGHVARLGHAVVLFCRPQTIPSHVYVPHWPIVWLSISVLALVWYWIEQSKAAVCAVLLGLTGISHMVLDSVVGDIGWLKPWHDGLYAIFEVSNRYSPWQLNFIIHWSFAMELLLLALSIWQWQRISKRPVNG